MDHEEEKSVAWVIVMLMTLVAALGWGLMAAGYAHSELAWRTGGVAGADEPSPLRRAGRRALADFVGNAVEQIPNAGPVLAYSFTHRIWLPIAVLVVEGLILFGGFKMKKLERELNGPAQRRGSERR